MAAASSAACSLARWMYFCVVDSRPRHWEPQDLRTLEVLAHAASGEVALRVGKHLFAGDRFVTLIRTV